MPEYDVEEESAFWPWVIGIVVLAMVVWVAAVLSGDSQADNLEQGSSAARPAARPPATTPLDSVITVESFRSWVRDSAEVQERAGSSYVEAGLARLVAVLDGVVDPDTMMAADTAGDAAAVGADSGLRARIAALRRSTEPAPVRMLEALEIATAVNASRGTADGAARNLVGAREALEELDATAPMPQQRHRVYRFFDFMAESLLPSGGTAVDRQTSP